MSEKTTASPAPGRSRQQRRAAERTAQPRRNRPRLRPSIVSVAAATAAFGTAEGARAATYDVTNLGDSGAGSLRQAIYDANANPGADIVTFSGAGASGTIDLLTQIRIDDDLDIQGPGQTVLSITGDGNRMLYLYAGDKQTLDVSISGLRFADGEDKSGGAIEIDAYEYYRGPYYGYVATGGVNLTVTDSTFEDNDALYDDGGAISADSGEPTLVTVTIEGSTFRDNNSRLDGGAIEVDGTLTVRDSLFEGNSAGSALYSGNGGAITVDSSNSTDLLIEDSVFSGNHATGDGGALYMAGDGVTIRRSEFVGNTADDDGGGIYLYDMDDPVLLEDVILAKNSAGEAGGGAFFYDGDDGITLRRVQIRDNQADGDGGGLVLYSPDDDYSGTVLIEDTTIANNEAGGNGGGLWMLYDTDNDGLEVEIVNTTISGNKAAGAGGGAYLDFLYGEGFYDVSVAFRHVTMAGNTSGTANGGITLATDWTVEIENSVLADNSAADLSNSDGGFALRFSLIEAPGIATITDNGGNLLGQDPALGPLQDNGGSLVGSPAQGTPEALLTQVPAAGSPAINAGDPAFVSPPDFDERGDGFPRVNGGRLDMGAIETNSSVLAEIPTLGGAGRVVLGGLCLLAAAHFLRRRRLAPGALAVLLAAGALRLEAAPEAAKGSAKTGDNEGRRIAATVVSADATQVVFRLADGSLFTVQNSDLKTKVQGLAGGASAGSGGAQGVSTGRTVVLKIREGKEGTKVKVLRPDD